MLCFSVEINAAPPSPGTVIAPIDKPIIQPKPNQTPQISRDKKQSPVAPQSTAVVTVDAFIFEGNTSYSNAALQSVIAEYIGKALSITEIYHVADVVESYYRYNGFLLTSVYVPAQQINSGSIILEVIEGRLGAINIDGELDSYTPEFLSRQADRLKPGEIIDDKTLESETLLMGDLPGLESRAVISPGAEYGTSDVVFINEEDRYSSVVQVNNYGRKSIGEQRVEAGFLMANPVSQGDLLNLSAIVSQSSLMFYGRADYSALINTSGTRVGGGISLFDYDVDTNEIGIPGQTLGGSGTTITFNVSHPIKRSTRSNLNLVANIKRSSTSENGSASTRPDNDINLLDVSLYWDWQHRDTSKTSLQTGLTTNFKSRESVTDNTAQKAKLLIDIKHQQPFLDNWFFMVHAQYVYSPDPLADVERFRVGGKGSVRAYPSAELAGDKGGLISVDVGTNIIFSKSLILVPSIFIDAGKVQRIAPVGQPKEESIAGYGIGLSAIFSQKHTVEAEIATPSSDSNSSDGRDTRFWLNYRGIL